VHRTTEKLRLSRHPQSSYAAVVIIDVFLPICIPHSPPTQHFSSNLQRDLSQSFSDTKVLSPLYILRLLPSDQPLIMSFQDKAQGQINLIDKELSKYPILNNLEKQTSVPKVYAFLGLLATYFFFIFFNIGGQLLTNLAGFIIPGYYSLEALFSVGKADDTQWLTVRL